MSATGDDETGFTLLEMLTVLALTALISAIAFPRLQTAMTAVGRAQTEQAVMSDLRLAKAQSLRSGAPVRVAIDEDGRGYGWAGGPNRRLTLDTAISAPGSSMIAFFPDGSASAGALILSQGARRSAFRVAATGQLSVQQDPVVGP